MDTKIKRHLGLLFGVMLVITACTGQTPSAAPASQAPAPSEEASVAPSTPAESASPSPLAADPAEAVIPNVEPNAEITVWTFWLSTTFDPWIADTISRFKETYPGVEVKWEDHQRAGRDQPVGR
jgi:ABC-type glycerol-3-phosphate transport system substrate-binding protein